MEYTAAALLITLALLFASLCLNYWLYLKFVEAAKYGDEQFLRWNKGQYELGAARNRILELEKRFDWLVEKDAQNGDRGE